MSGLGGGNKNQMASTLPPPPPPVIKYDPATSAAEAALAASAKQSFASSVETDEDKAKKAGLGATTAAAPQGEATQTKKPRRDPASMMQASGGMGQSAVLTG